MYLDEAIDKQGFECTCLMGDLVIAICLLGRGGMFKPIQRGLARQRLAPLASCLQLTRQRCHHRIATQLILIVQILVAQRNANNTLQARCTSYLWDIQASRHVGALKNPPKRVKIV